MQEAKWYELAPKNIAEKAFDELRKHADIGERKIILTYSGHFRHYNSNARYNKHMIEFNLSSKWRDVDEDIQQGLIESLIVRVHRLRVPTTANMQLYENFMKNLSKYAKKHTHDPVLAESFMRVNDRFFDGMMEMPNLIFASESFTKLGSYEYGTDTVHISRVFENLPEEDRQYLDYVMYHELLHKKHAFKVKNGRHHAHTTAFRRDEGKFGEDMENQLSRFLRRKKRGSSLKSMFSGW